MDEAVGLTAEILAAWAPILRDVSLKAASGGRLEVSADGSLVFSKVRLGRHPRKGEIVELLAAHLGAPLDWR